MAFRLGARSVVLCGFELEARPISIYAERGFISPQEIPADTWKAFKDLKGRGMAKIWSEPGSCGCTKGPGPRSGCLGRRTQFQHWLSLRMDQRYHLKERYFDLCFPARRRYN
jgi:hypothetical protein